MKSQSTPPARRLPQPTPILWGVKPARAKSPELSFSGRSDRGLVRETNEDFIQVFQQHGIFFLADGIGGQQGGEVASSRAAKSVEQYFDLAYSDGLMNLLRSGGSIRAPAADLRAALVGAHRDIVAERRGDPALLNMGTTVVCMLIVQGKAYIAHAGDSRCYVLRGNKFRQLTRDHSLANELKHLGSNGPGISRELGARENIIVRSLGAASTDRAKVDIAEFPVHRGDRFLLCSDGLTNEVPAERIGRILSRAGSARAATGELVDSALEAGGRDNVSVIVVFVR